jgi:hypothetical protein
MFRCAHAPNTALVQEIGDAAAGLCVGVLVVMFGDVGWWLVGVLVCWCVGGDVGWCVGWCVGVLVVKFGDGGLWGIVGGCVRLVGWVVDTQTPNTCTQTLPKGVTK